MSDATAPPPQTRREMLERCAIGFGGVALAGLLGDPRFAAAQSAARKPHFPPKAKNVIFLYMDGGPSQVDTFDYKPIPSRPRSTRAASTATGPTRFTEISAC